MEILQAPHLGQGIYSENLVESMHDTGDSLSFTQNGKQNQRIV